MTTVFYRVDFNDQIFTFKDEFNWDISDSYEREALFVDIGSHNYDHNKSSWEQNPTHEIIICEEDGVPIRGMIVTMRMEPTFNAEEKYPLLDD